MSGLHAVTGAHEIEPRGGPAALFLHGYGSHERDLTSLARWVPERISWASLRAPMTLPQGGNAWFPITTPGNPDPDPVAVGTDAIWSWADQHLGSSANVIPNRVLAGRADGDTASQDTTGACCCDRSAERFRQASHQPGDETLASLWPAVFWGCGADDRVITPEAGRRTKEWLPAHSTLTERVYSGVGHGLDASEMDEVRLFVAERSMVAAKG